MKTNLLCFKFGIAFSIVALMSCASVDRKVEILHSDSGLKESNVYTLVVFPPTLPKYLEGWVEAEKLSADMWQIFHTTLKSEAMLLLADPQKVWVEILSWNPTPREWIFAGNRETATKVARNLSADGFVMISIEDWKEGGLNVATIKMRCTLIRTADETTLLDIRETAISQTDRPSISAKELSLDVSRNISKKLIKAMNTGQPTKALHMSPRIITGAGLITAGFVTGFGSLHMHNMAEECYDRYKSADKATEIDKFEDMTHQYDDLSMLLALGSAGLISTGAALIFTDYESYSFSLTPCIVPQENGILLLSIRFDF